MNDVEIPNGEDLDKGERGIGVAISILAILLAITSALGNKADNDEIVGRVDESNTWAQYQAKKVRSTTLEIASNFVDVLSTLQGKSAESDQKVTSLRSHYGNETKRYEGELVEIKKKAEDFRSDADGASRQGDMYDMAEFLYQVSLVLASVTLLIKSKTYFRVGATVATGATAILAYSYFLL